MSVAEVLDNPEPGVALVDLEPHHCRALIGGLRYCGVRIVSGAYCLAHAREFFTTSALPPPADLRPLPRPRPPLRVMPEPGRDSAVHIDPVPVRRSRCPRDQEQLICEEVGGVHRFVVSPDAAMIARQRDLAAAVPLAPDRAPAAVVDEVDSSIPVHAALRKAGDCAVPAERPVEPPPPFGAQVLELNLTEAQRIEPKFHLPVTGAGMILSRCDLPRTISAVVWRLLSQFVEMNRPLSPNDVDRVVTEIVERRTVRIDDIIRVVAEHFEVTKQDLLSARRTANVVLPRQIAMYFAKTMTLRSLPEIGRRFGGRDHTTVLHAVRKIEKLVCGDREFADTIAALRSRIGERP